MSIFNVESRVEAIERNLTSLDNHRAQQIAQAFDATHLIYRQLDELKETLGGVREFLGTEFVEWKAQRDFKQEFKR